MDTDMSDLALTIFEDWHFGVNVLAITFNSLMIYLCLYKTPKAIKSYSILMLNFALSDLGASLTDFFVCQRIIPAGWTIGFISSGPCQYISRFSCFLGYSLNLHFLSHSLISLLVSFAYRYYILFNASPRRLILIIILFVVYLPSGFEWVYLAFFGYDDPEHIEHIVHEMFPHYYLENKTITGISNIFENIPALYTIAWQTMPVSPIYICILILRVKILKQLQKVADKMSSATQDMHRSLLWALSLQALLPLFFLLAVICYALGQLGIYNHPALEYMTFSVSLPIPLVSPLISIYFVRPYRAFVCRCFCRVRVRIVNAITPSSIMGESNRTLTDPSRWHKGTEFQSGTVNPSSMG
ncbi:hypothetical protein WR25_18144 [Diploscapter pachys]|uniref:G-protein coupled receptors family 1 profile domain-containing protein n=1 Tax=Diploscapter pachys TaxID=2018661 RepID=A0A2A2LZC1_9BILA|nr:hypothetical protein WR25_18144 [Diploscapter pachys]